jgi:hypothetical protein
MIYTIAYWNIRNIIRVDALQTPNIESVLVWIGACLVMRVDATVRTEIVLCNPRIELIELKVLSTFEDADTLQWHIGHNRSFAPTNRTITPFRVNKAIWQIKFEFHHAAVARSPVLELNLNFAHLLYH